MRNGKVLLLKLGGSCNLRCSHCHCAVPDYELNPDIFPFIRKTGFRKIVFSGGEPLLFLDKIKAVVEEVPESTQFSLVTNGTLLDRKTAMWLDDHDFTVSISYDGNNSTRDKYGYLDWENLLRMRSRGIATLYTGAEPIGDVFNDVIEVKRKYRFPSVNEPLWVNFCHQTKYAPNPEVTREHAMEYCRFMGAQVELALRLFVFVLKRERVPSVLADAIKLWATPRDGRGVKCFNERLYNMTLSGDFLLCPYDPETFGNIYTGVDWDKVESRIPERCKSCPIWGACRCSCVANITENDCYIARVMHRHLMKLMGKYGVTYEELDDLLQ